VKDTIVAATTVLTADRARPVLSPGWVRIVDGEIVAVEEGAPPSTSGAAAAAVVRGDLVMPGLISAHQHLVDLLVRGGPTGPTFFDWLLGTYHRGLALAQPEECRAAIATVRASGLAAGVTTVVDCWSVGPVDDAERTRACAHASATAHLASGGRTLFAPMFCEVVPGGWTSGYGIDPTRLCRPAEESLRMVRELAAELACGRLSITPSPELPEAVTPAGLEAAHALAAELGTMMPTHFCPSPPSRAAFGPADARAVGILGPRMLAAHCAAIDAADVVEIGGAGVHVAHCPTASRALGRSMLTPLAALRRAGAVGGLGLDNASLQSTSDLFAEARQAAIIARGQEDSLHAGELFELLTIEAARAIGMGDRVGSLAAGKRGDLLVLDVSRPHWWPRRRSWIDTVVEVARADDVRVVLVDGEVVASDGVARRQGDVALVESAAARIRAAWGWS